MPFTELVEGREILERIREGIADLDIKIKPNESIHMSVSIGLTILDVNASAQRQIFRQELHKDLGREIVYLNAFSK